MRSVLVMAALAAGCGDAACEIERIEPCADCPPGDVAGGLIARSGDVDFAARPGGGYVRLCGGELAWLDERHEVERAIELDLREFSGLEAVGPDDTAYVIHGDYDGDASEVELIAVGRDGERWRRPLGYDAFTFAVTPAADAVYLHGNADRRLELDGAFADAMFVARLDEASGAVEWLWTTDETGFVDVAALPGGAVAVAGRFDAATLDLGGAAEPVTGDGATGFVGVLDADGAGVWARAIGGHVTYVDAAPDGTIALTGTFGAEPLDLGDGVVVPASTDVNQYVGVLEADGAARWAIPMGDPFESFRGIVARGDAVVVSGQSGDGLLDPVEVYLASASASGVGWVTDVRADGYAPASLLGGPTLAVQLDLYANDESGPTTTLDLGRLHVDGEATVLVELVP